MTGTASKPSAKKTIEEILAARDAARQEIYSKARQISDRAEAIKDRGYDRPLTAEEIGELGELTAAMGALRDAENELVMITVRALDESPEVTRLINVITGVNDSLSAKLKEIQSVAKTVKKIGDLIRAVEKVVQGLGKLAAMMP